MDLNRDGKVDLLELQHRYQIDFEEATKREIMQYKYLMELEESKFAVADRDRDGFLNVAELHGAGFIGYDNYRNLCRLSILSSVSLL